MTEKPREPKDSEAPTKGDLELFDSPCGGPPPMPRDDDKPDDKEDR